MKTTVLFRVLFLAMMALVSVGNVNAQDENFITNEEKVDGLVVSKTVYRLEGSLHRHMKYDFTYDEQNRMTTKEAFKWNAGREKWMPYFKVNYSYSISEITMLYGRWNELHKAYDAGVEKSVYELNEANMPVACLNYKWNKGQWLERQPENWVMNIQTPTVNRNDSLLTVR